MSKFSQRVLGVAVLVGGLGGGAGIVHADQGGTTDLGISITGPTTAVPVDATVTYIARVTNAGPSLAPDVQVVFQLDPQSVFVSAAGTGWTCATASPNAVHCATQLLPLGDAAPISIVVAAPSPAPRLQCDGSVSSNNADSNLANQTSVAFVDVVDAVDLSVSATADPTSGIVAGGAVAYTLAVTNHGPSVAAAITVTDTLPAGTQLVGATGTGWTCAAVGQLVSCTRPSLAIGDAPAIDISATAPANGQAIVDTVAVSSQTLELQPADNTATLAEDVTSIADVSLVASADASTVDVGGALTYTLTIHNEGPSDAEQVVVTDTLPAGAALGAVVAAGWTCTNDATTVTCTAAALAAGATEMLSIQVAPTEATPAATNVAAVASVTADATVDNNQASTTTTVEDPDGAPAESAGSGCAVGGPSGWGTPLIAALAAMLCGRRRRSRNL